MDDRVIKVMEHCKLDLPEDVLHKGRPVKLTGKVAVEVELPDGKRAWTRSLELPGKPAARKAAHVAPRKPAAKKAAAKAS